MVIALSICIGALLFQQFSFFTTRDAALKETASIGEGNPTFGELLKRFSALAREKGAPYAFDVLASADLPPETDLHLIAHEIGHELYVQQGIDGMRVCTQDFRNGCSHAIVVETMQELGDGDEVRALIDAACEKAPGGSSAYGMCYHGLGHGVLSFYGFTLPKTIEFCMKTGTEDREYVQSHECVGGAIMELIQGGGHDRDAWTKANERYLSKEDPLSPCSTDLIPSSEKPRCYVYMSPHLIEVAGGTISNHTLDQLTEAMRMCTTLPYGPERSACIGGFGKDFPHFVTNHDVRKLDRGDLSDQDLRGTDAYCRLLSDKNDILACESYALSTFFWGGDADPSLSIRFCGMLPDDGSRAFCYNDLASSIAKYIAPERRSARCAPLGETYRARCVGEES